MHLPSRFLGLLLLALTTTAFAQLELEGPGDADDSIQDADVAALDNWLRDMREASAQEDGDGVDPPPVRNTSLEEMVANSQDSFDALMEQCMVDESITAEREDTEQRLSELGEEAPIEAVRELQTRLLSLGIQAQRDCCERGEILCAF